MPTDKKVCPLIADQTSLHGALPTTAGSDQSNIRARFHSYVETTKHTDSRSRWIAEVNVLEADMALDTLGNLALGRFGVDIRPGIK